MTLRTIACCATLVLGLLFSLSFGAAMAQPLDLMKFMQGKPTAAHADKSRHHHGRAVASKHGKHSAADAQTESTPPQPEAATAFAPEAKPADQDTPAGQDAQPNVDVVTGDQFNEIDRTAGPGPEASVPGPETNGTATPAAGAKPAAEENAQADQNVQTVDAAAFNELDGKAAATMPQPAQDGKASISNTSISWMETLWTSWSSWLWSSLSSAATLVRNLFG